MASTDALPIARKNVAFRVTFVILDADGDLVSGASGLDSEVSKDGGSFTDCTNEATEIGASGMYYLDLTSTEMNADCVAVIVKTSTSGAKTVPLVLYPAEDADLRANVVQFGGSNGTFASGRPETNVTHIAGSAVSTSTAQLGVNVVDAGGTAWATVITNLVTSIWAAGTRTLTAISDSSGVTTLLGKLTGITSLAQWLGLIAGKQTGNSTARTELRATGAGSGTFDETSDSLEAVRDRGDASWTTATGFATSSALDDVASDAAAAKSASEAAVARLVALAVATGAVQTDGGNSATAVKTNLTEAEDDHWLDAFLLITSGALTGQVRRITAYDGTTKVVTTKSFTDVPADDVTFAIINR